MARTIKKVSHDLVPLSDAITELASETLKLLNSMKVSGNFNNLKELSYFDDCVEASQMITSTSKLIRQYLHELEDEADREGILKD